MTKDRKVFLVNGKNMTLSEISKAYNINYATLRARSLKGLIGDDLIAKSSKKPKLKKTPVKNVELTVRSDNRETISFDQFVDEITNERKKLLEKIS